jgi:NAD(P)-dependent dehydrogenase (short-subunit alcohol dehydrogenase family)
MELSGRVAIVTGGTSGLGLGMVERFVAEGAKVVIADIDADQGKEVAARYGEVATFRWTDVGNPDDIRDIVDFTVSRYGGLHVMVNNAAIAGPRHHSLLDMDFAAFDRVLRVNLLGVMAGTQQAARHMAANGGGSVINMSSIAALQPNGGQPIYATSKAAIILFTKSAAVDLGQHDVRVNCIVPAHIVTPILAKLLEDLPEDERAATLAEIRAGMRARQPLQRQGTADDVAAAAVYFASDRSAFVTGTVLSVDGGAAAGTPLPRPPGIRHAAANMSTVGTSAGHEGANHDEMGSLG